MATRRKRVREPIQVYLAGEERALLDQLAGEAGVSRAEVLRRGLRALARDHQPWERSPVLEWMRSLGEASGSLPPDVAERHDAYLDEGARGDV